MKYGSIESIYISQSSSFWQSPVWKNILLHSNQASEVFYYGNTATSWLLVEIRSIGFGLYGAFSLGIESQQVGEDFGDMIDDLTTFLKKKKVVFLQIEPIEEGVHLDQKYHLENNYKVFLTRYTRVLDLNTSEDQILLQMHEKGRYNIRLAQKRGVTVSKVSPNKENIDTWMNLLSETTLRDGFSGNSRRYYESFLQEIEKVNLGGLYFAELEGRIIAGGIFVFSSSRSIYYYGASSSKKEDKRNMAPYLLQWTAISEAKYRNIPIFDFLGVADPTDPTDSLQGVTDFKEKFGGRSVSLPNKYIIPTRYMLFRLFFTIRNLKNLFRF